MKDVIDFLVSLMPLAIILAIAYGIWRYKQATVVPTPALASAPARTGYEIICPNPNCGYRGAPRKVERGSVVVGLLLCCFLIVPGVIYFIARGGYRYLCPRCGLQVRSDN